MVNLPNFQCVKNVRIWSFPSLYFLAVRLNTLYLSVFSPNVGKYGLEKTQNTDTFYAVFQAPKIYLNQ